MLESWDVIYARFADEIQEAEDILGREFIEEEEVGGWIMFVWEADEKAKEKDLEAPLVKKLVAAIKDGFKPIYDEGGKEAKRRGVGRPVRENRKGIFQVVK